MPEWPGAILPSTQNPTAPEPKRPNILLKPVIVFLVLTVIVILAIPAWNNIQNRKISKQQTAQKTEEQSTITSFQETHPELFYAEIEYNPETKVSILLANGKTNGDLPLLNPTEPPDSPTQFIYKIEVISKDDRLMQYGWVSTPKERILTTEGSFRLFILIQYHQESTIQLELPNGQVIWTGLME